ncbi:MAG: ABC transporter permease [Thermodesulfobacteriota bacterium]
MTLPLLRGWSAVYWRELLILRRRLSRMAASMAVSPLLYVVAFGWAFGDRHMPDGRTYLEFLIPGLAAMASMTQAWSMASEINISRFYWHIFEEFQAAPVSHMGYVLGEVLGGVTRTLLAVAVICGIGFAFGVPLRLGPLFWLAAALNGWVFASLAVASAMLVRTHADQALATSFIITPMGFLGGTFFPLERLPDWARSAVQLLPVTHAAGAMRPASYGLTPPLFSYLLLAGLGLACFLFAARCVDRARD